MSNDEEEKKADQLAAQHIIDTFKRYTEIKSQSNPAPFIGKHLSVVALGRWADGEKPENWLEEYLARNAEHFSQCATCQRAVEYYKNRPNPGSDEF